MSFIMTWAVTEKLVALKNRISRAALLLGGPQQRLDIKAVLLFEREAVATEAVTVAAAAVAVVAAAAATVATRRQRAYRG